MAETWGEYFGGTPERRLKYADEQRRQADAVRQSPLYRSMSAAADNQFYADGNWHDPRELRMEQLQPTLMAPGDQTEAADDLGAAADYVLDFGGRMRDTAFTGVAEASRGNYGRAAWLALRAPHAGFYPSAGAGMRGQPDDWRAAAERNGVPAHHVMAADILTDPENWASAPIKGPLAFVVPGVPLRMAGAAARTAATRGDDVLRALGRVRYGRGVPTYLVDEAGEPIRRLMNSPGYSGPARMGGTYSP